MKLKSLFYFVLLAALFFVALRWPVLGSVAMFAIAVSMSYLYAFTGIIDGGRDERFRKGGYLFGGGAYACLLAITGRELFRMNLEHRFSRLHFLMNPSDPRMEVSVDSSDFMLETVWNLTNFSRLSGISLAGLDMCILPFQGELPAGWKLVQGLTERNTRLVSNAYLRQRQ